MDKTTKLKMEGKITITKIVKGIIIFVPWKKIGEKALSNTKYYTPFVPLSFFVYI
jgi:hypothetical protein